MKDKERIVYAPFSSLGAINFDKTSGYISIPDKYVVFTKTDEVDNLIPDNEGQKMVRKLQERKFKDDEEMNDNNDLDILDGVAYDHKKDKEIEIDKQKEKRRVVLTDGKIKEYANRKEAQVTSNTENQEKETCLYQDNKIKSLADLIYDTEPTDNDSDINKLDTTNIKLSDNLSESLIYKKASSKFKRLHNTINEQIDEEYQQNIDFMRKLYKMIIKRKFVTGGPKVEGLDEMLPSDSDDEELKRNLIHRKNKVGDESDEEDEKEYVKPHLRNAPTKEEFIKIKKRQDFIGEEYGFVRGTYIRVEVEVDKQIATMMDPHTVVTLCALEKQEESFGYMRMRIKKHRWYPHILKNKDPLIFSIGWRRFQSVPVFVTEDQNERTRMLKYTPKFGFCYGVFYGPLYPLTTSFICIQRLDDKISHFRIAANGMIVELNQNFRVMKKLKLVGEPFQIFKNTAFVKKMFNSELEVAKYEGARLQTTSGIRGQIKKALVGNGTIPGSFRATFEDKLKKSDIVFCKAWVTLNETEIPKFYNPVYSFGNTRLLKMTSEIRRENDIELKFPKDSQYIMREEEEKLKQARDEKVSMPLHVPKNITKALPFKSKAKVRLVHDFEGEDRRRRTNLLQKLNLPSKRPFKSQFLNNSDKKIYSLVQRLGTIGKQKYKENQKKLEVIDEKKKKEDAKREDAIKKARNRKREEKMKRKRQ